MCFLSVRLEAGRYKSTRCLHVESKPMEKKAEGKEGARELNPGDIVEPLCRSCLISYKLFSPFLMVVSVGFLSLTTCHCKA